MNKSTTITILVLVSILLIAAWFVIQSTQQKQQQQLESSSAAQGLVTGTSPDNFVDFNGNSTDLNQYLGKTLVVNSWASWSPASVQELQLLAEVAGDYSPDEVVVLAVNRAEASATAEQFLMQLDLTDSVVLILDTQDRYYRAIGGYAMPETVIYNAQGDVVQHFRVPVTKSQLTRVLDEALAQTE